MAMKVNTMSVRFCHTAYHSEFYFKQTFTESTHNQRLRSVQLSIGIWDHSFSTYAKFSEKLTFLTPRYAHIRIRVVGRDGG